MKKLAFLFILVAVALIIDGTLARDIFDYRIESPAGWVSVLLILAIYAAIAWVESTKKNEKENNRK